MGKGVLGFKIDAEKSVLKQGAPCALSARAWLGGDRFRPADAAWSSEDGKFDGSRFTPAKSGFAVVRATIGGVTVEKKLPVEEALVATRFTSGPNRVALDQFGGEMKTTSERAKAKGMRAR